MAGRQMPPSNSIIPLLDIGRKYDEKLVGQDKDRQITQLLLSWENQTQLGEIEFIAS